MKNYKGLEETKIVQELCFAIIARAILDCASAKDDWTSYDLKSFFQSQWCEWLCYALKLNFCYVEKYVQDVINIDNQELRQKKLLLGLNILKNKI